MNLKTIADLAGVSVSTVSKAFSGSEEIGEKTRERIFKIAKENGCFDKYNKNKFRKKIIGVICPELESEYYTKIVTMLNEKITANNGVMVCSVSEFSEDNENEQFLYFSSYCKVDGVIIIGMHNRINNSINIPTVAIGGKSASPNIDTINTNIEAAVDEAVMHLKKKGHTKIAFVGENLTKGKLELFKSAMKKAGLFVRPDYIKTSNKRFEEAGIKTTDELLALSEPPSAIMAAYDYIAIGVAKSICEHGYKVGKDIAVVGMDDIGVVPYLDTPLSSIRTHIDEACAIAVDLIMKKIDNQYYSAKQRIEIQSEFIIRASTD